MLRSGGLDSAKALNSAFLSFAVANYAQDSGVPREWLHPGPEGPVFQTQSLQRPDGRRAAAGRSFFHGVQPACRPLPTAGRRYLRLRPPHVLRARHLQVDGTVLAQQAHQELLEEHFHALLESGQDAHHWVIVIIVR